MMGLGNPGCADCFAIEEKPRTSEVIVHGWVDKVGFYAWALHRARMNAKADEPGTLYAADPELPLWLPNCIRIGGPEIIAGQWPAADDEEDPSDDAMIALDAFATPITAAEKGHRQIQMASPSA